MDIDFGTVIYIVLGIIYFIFQSNSKNKKKRQQEERYEEKQPTQTTTQRRPSFEELLEEFTGQKTLTPEPVTKPVVEQPKERIEEKPSRSNYEIAKERTTQRKREAEAEAARIRSKFDDHFEHYEIEEEEVENDYAEMFADLDSTKKAFVASEIFNRKFN